MSNAPEGWAEYCAWMYRRTGPHADPVQVGQPSALAYCVIGLCEESEEFMSARLFDESAELGDVAFYLALTERALGFDVQWSPVPEGLARHGGLSDSMSRLGRCACVVAGLAKRPLTGRPIDREKMDVALANFAAWFLYHCEEHGGLRRILDESIDKNKRRFGDDGWTLAAAIEAKS